MPFYAFKQNNSGGSFEHDEKSGIGYAVIIEAENAALANHFAEEIGLYFDGCSTGQDCSCCGDRWSEQWGDDDGDEVPSLWGQPIEEARKIDPQRSWSSGWWKLPVYVHYRDGTMKTYTHEKDEQRAAASA